MTINEAAFHLIHHSELFKDKYPKELVDAMKLGYEALRWVTLYRPDNKTDRWSLLPGETES